MSPEPKLSIRNLRKQFPGPPPVVAFDGISFDVADREFVSIVGPSGCGKTTLLHVVSGLEMQTSGTVAVDGVSVAAAKRTALCGYMFQKDLLFPWKRVLDNVALGLTLGGVSKKEARQRANALLEQYGLDGFARAYPPLLSGGMRQRAAVMRTLLVDRPIMLLDEPFGALDAITRSVMQQWLVSVWEERRGTLLFITHDTEEAILLSDRVLLMSSRPGRIAMDLRIDLPRPRTEEVANSVEALAYRRQVVDMLTGYPRRTANPPTAPPQISAFGTS